MWARGRARYGRFIAICALTAGLLAVCSGDSLLLAASSDTESSVGSLFSRIFGSKSQAVGEAPSPNQAATDTELTCPPVSIRAGAATLSVGLPGKPASGSDLRYQVTITRTARDCNLQGSQITARIGIEGRVIVGPAGAPPAVDIPLRVAVVQEGIQDKIIFTKFYHTVVSMIGGDNVAYSFVAEDVTYPVPQGDTGDSYLFYIGFDPNSLKSQPAPRGAKRAGRDSGSGLSGHPGMKNH